MVDGRLPYAAARCGDDQTAQPPVLRARWKRSAVNKSAGRTTPSRRGRVRKDSVDHKSVGPRVCKLADSRSATSPLATGVISPEARATPCASFDVGAAHPVEHPGQTELNARRLKRHLSIDVGPGRLACDQDPQCPAHIAVPRDSAVHATDECRPGASIRHSVSCPYTRSRGDSSEFDFSAGTGVRALKRVAVMEVTAASTSLRTVHHGYRHHRAARRE